MASFVNIPIAFIFLAFLLGSTVLVFSIFRGRKLFIAGLVIVLFAFGILRMNSALQPDDQLREAFGSVREFQGAILETPKINGANAQIIVETNELADALARVLIFTRRFPEFHRGETVKISGTVESIESEAPDYRMFLRQRGISGIMRYPAIELADNQTRSFIFQLERIKNYFSGALKTVLPEPDASYMLGILIGERAAISPELQTAFQRTGTSHLVALSGFNITIVALAIGWVLSGFYLSSRVKLATSAAAVTLFVVLVGGGASVVRAAIMGVLALVALERGRVYEITNALIFAACVMIFISPYLLRFDLSFQLSFLATLGIIIVPPRMEALTGWLAKDSGFTKILYATLGAELFVLPLILWHFGRVSLIGPLANVLVLPLIPATMLLGFITGAVGMISSLSAVPLGWASHLLVSYELGVIQLLSAFPGSSAMLPKVLAWASALPALWLAAIYVKDRFRHARSAR